MQNIRTSDSWFLLEIPQFDNAANHVACHAQWGMRLRVMETHISRTHSIQSGKFNNINIQFVSLGWNVPRP